MATVLSLRNAKLAAPLGPLVVRFDRVYGNVTCYPADEVGRDIVELTNKKIFSPRDLVLLVKIGFEIQLAHGSRQLLEDFVAGRS